MDTFAFIIHPIDPKRDVSRKFPLLGRLLNVQQINWLSTYFPPIYISQIDGLRSAATGKEVRGWFVACPLTPTRMLELPEKTVYRKIVQTGRLAERLGAQVLGLGAEWGPAFGVCYGRGYKARERHARLRLPRGLGGGMMPRRSVMPSHWRLRRSA